MNNKIILHIIQVSIIHKQFEIIIDYSYFLLKKRQND